MAPWQTSLWAALLATGAAVAPTLAQDSGFVNGRTALTPETSEVVPNRFIIELSPSNGKGLRAREEGIKAVVEDINALGYEAKVKEDFSSVSTRFDGVSVEVTGGNSSNETGAAEDIKKLPSVAEVWPVFAVTLGEKFEAATKVPEWNPHAFTHVKELHDRKLTGSGQRVCVVDSGVDVNHPAFKGNIAGGKNLFDGSNNLEDCSGHGTFVTSMIVADTKDFHGVAPGAEVYMYKVFGCDTTTSTDLILKGILAADADKCEIISLSLGSNNGYRNTITSRLTSQIAKDRLVIVAAGNDGAMGPFFASSPAVAQGALSVGSVEADQILAWPATVVSSNGESVKISYVTPTGFKHNETVDVPLHFDYGDSCNFQGKGNASTAVLAKRGVCLGRFAARAAEDAGYGYALAFDAYYQGVYYETDITQWYWGQLKFFGITATSLGSWARKQVEAGNKLRLKIQADAQPIATNPADIPGAGHVSRFSSWGPSYENDVAPAISAPGGAVYGAVSGGKYAITSGTSFSCPYVAGVAALYYAHVKKDKDQFMRRIITTARGLPAYDANDNKVIAEIASVAQQGAGLINVAQAFSDSVILLSEPIIHLNDTDNRITKHTIRVQNTGLKKVDFKISHLPASTVSTTNSNGYVFTYYPPLSDAVATLKAPKKLSIPAGATREISVTFSTDKIPKGKTALWSGKIVLQGSNDQAIALPYLGVEASTYNWGALHHGAEVYRYDSGTGILYPVDHFKKPYKPAEGDSPEVWFAFRYGTYEFSVDIVGEDWKLDQFSYPPESAVGKNAWYGSIRHEVIQGMGFTDFPMKDVVRFSSGKYVTFRSLANGTHIPTGRYRVLSRALRMFGDAKNPKDWQLFLSDSFPVQLGDDELPVESTTQTLSATATTLSATSAAATITSISTTDPVTTTTAAVVSVPGATTTLTVAAQPTGLEGALSLKLQRMRDPSPHINDPSAWLELHIQVDIPNPVPEGSSISFGIPEQLTNISTVGWLEGPATKAGSTSFDEKTRLFTIALDDWVTWHKNIKGDFYVMCRLTPEFAKKMKKGTYIFEFPVPGGVITSPLYRSAIDRSSLFERAAMAPWDNTTLFVADIEVPAAMGPWDWVQLQVAHEDDNGFVCDESGVFIGKAGCGDRRFRKTKDVTKASTEVCATRKFRMKYNKGLKGKDEILRFRVAGIQSNQMQWTYSIRYALDMMLSNGTGVPFDLRTIKFEKNPRTRATNFNHFTGERVTKV